MRNTTGHKPWAQNRNRPVLVASLDAKLLAELRARAERDNVPISRLVEKVLRAGMAAVAA